MRWFLTFLSVFIYSNFAIAEIDASESLSLDQLFAEIVESELNNTMLVVKCEFTCQVPIVHCGDWSPPPGSYSKDIRATKENANLACRAAAESICRRCSDSGLASYWYTLFRSVRWTSSIQLD